MIIPDHMPKNHRKYLSYNDDEFLSWAAAIGTATHGVVKFFLESGKVSEQGYKACASLTKLADRYGHGRVEAACSRVLSYASQPSIRNIGTMLKNRQDTVDHSSGGQGAVPGRGRGITRGVEYFRKGDASHD